MMESRFTLLFLSSVLIKDSVGAVGTSSVEGLETVNFGCANQGELQKQQGGEVSEPLSLLYS